MTRTQLTHRGMALYGIGEWGTSALETFLRIHLLIFCTDVLGIEPYAAGLMVACGVIWDGITDPIIGRLSDKSQSRFGRRIPWMLVGVLTLPIWIAGLFYLPQLTDGQILFVGVAYCLINTSMTLISVPHSALGGDLSDQPAQRTEIYAWRYVFTIFGLLAGIAIPGYLLQAHGQGLVSYQGASNAVSGLILVSSLLCIWQCRRFDKPQQRTGTEPRVPTYGHMLRDRPFLILVLAYLAATIGQAINSSLALYYYRYRLELQESHIQGILIIFTLIISASIPLWQALGKRYDRRYLLCGSVFTLGLIGSIVYPLFPVGESWPPYIMAVIGGILVGSVFLMDVALADVADSDGTVGDYGSYFGLWKLTSKISRAVAIALAGLLLELVGFEAGQEPGEQTRWWLAVLFGPGVGVFFMLGAVIIMSLPVHIARPTEVSDAFAAPTNDLSRHRPG